MDFERIKKARNIEYTFTLEEWDVEVTIRKLGISQMLGLSEIADSIEQMISFVALSVIDDTGYPLDTPEGRDLLARDWEATKAINEEAKKLNRLDDDSQEAAKKNLKISAGA